MITILLLSLLLAGCYSIGNEAVLKAHAEDLVGASKDQLVKQYGPPTSTAIARRNGQVVQTYTWIYVQASNFGMKSASLTVELDADQKVVATSAR